MQSVKTCEECGNDLRFWVSNLPSCGIDIQFDNYKEHETCGIEIEDFEDEIIEDLADWQKDQKENGEF